MGDLRHLGRSESEIGNGHAEMVRFVNVVVVGRDLRVVIWCGKGSVCLSHPEGQG